MLIVLVVILALLAVGAELAGRRIAENVVRDRVASALGVATPSDLKVDLGSAPLLPQALQGRLQVVTVTTDQAELAGLHGDLTLVARNVELRDQVAGAVRTTIAIPNQSGLTALVKQATDVDSARFAGGRVVAAKRVSVLGASIDVSETLTVSADGGRIVFTPDQLTIGSAKVDVATVRRGPLASLLAAFTSPSSRCIDSTLPKGLHLERATLDGSTLHLLVAGIEVDLASGAKGACT